MIKSYIITKIPYKLNMNKLRLIKIYELKGKIHPIESFMIGVLDGIEEYQSHSEIIFYRKNGFNYLVHILSTNDIRTTNTLDYMFEKRFKCSIIERREIMKYLLEKHLKLTLNKVF